MASLRALKPPRFGGQPRGDGHPAAIIGARHSVGPACDPLA